MTEFAKIELTIKILTPYHVGSGYGLARLIDSLIVLDANGVPFLPGSSVLGIISQGLYDLLRFSYFDSERKELCEYQIHGGIHSGSETPNLPCAIIGRLENPCIMCRLFGSTAKDGLLNREDFKCKTDYELIKAIMNSSITIPEERRQLVKEAASHKRNMRTKTVKEKHFFVREEGALLEFSGTIECSEPISEHEAEYLAAALKNTHAIGSRKSRSKGACLISGNFIDISGNKKSDIELLKSLLS